MVHINNLDVHHLTVDGQGLSIGTVQEIAAEFLAEAETYADNHDATTLASANAYTDAHSGASVLDEAKTYADGVGTSTLSSANSYSDGVGTSTLSDAKDYADGVGTSTLSSANSYTDGAIGDAESYAETVGSNTLVLAKAYADGISPRKPYMGFRTGAQLNALELVPDTRFICSSEEAGFFINFIYTVIAGNPNTWVSEEPAPGWILYNTEDSKTYTFSQAHGWAWISPTNLTGLDDCPHNYGSAGQVLTTNGSSGITYSNNVSVTGTVSGGSGVSGKTYVKTFQDGVSPIQYEFQMSPSDPTSSGVGGVLVASEIPSGSKHPIGTAVGCPLRVLDTTSSTSSTTGAATINGGLGVTQNLNVGGNGLVIGTSTVNGIITTNTAVYGDMTGIDGKKYRLVFQASDASVTGCGGGLYALNVTDNIRLPIFMDLGSGLWITDSTASTSTSTGALRVNGGIGTWGSIHANKFYQDGVNYEEKDVSLVYVDWSTLKPTVIDLTSEGYLLVYNYPAGVTTAQYWNFRLPKSYVAGTDITVNFMWMGQNNNSGSVQWHMSWNWKNVGDSIASGQAAGHILTIANPGTGKVTSSSFPAISGSGKVAGSVISGNFYRDGAADSYASAARLTGISIKYQVNKIGDTA